MSDNLLAEFRTVAEAHHGITVKGRKMPYTEVNGNMFAFLAPDGALCLRFGEARRADIARRFGVGPVLQYRAVMRGYVAIPVRDLAKPDDLAAFFAESLAFARSLPPKPTTRKKP